MNQKRILVVDDERHMQRLIQFNPNSEVVM